jgi:hypothetical protein
MAISGGPIAECNSALKHTAMPTSALMVMRLFTRQASSPQSRALWEHIRLA